MEGKFTHNISATHPCTCSYCISDHHECVFLIVYTLPDSITCSCISTCQVPVLVDGEKVLNDSFEIAKYLEETYPDAPSLFGGPGGQAGCKFADAFFNDNTSCAPYNPYLRARLPFNCMPVDVFQHHPTILFACMRRFKITEERGVHGM